MFKLNWKSWLAVWLGLVLTTAGLVALLYLQDAVTVAFWLGFVGNLLVTGWTFFGLFHWRDVPFIKRINTFVMTLVGFGLLVSLFFAVDWETGWRTALYLALAVLGFLVGINLLRLLLRPGHPILGVARTMVEESLRMGIARAFIFLVLVALVILPLVLGSEDRVTYMVQRFLVYSTAWLAFLLSLMTVLVAAWSVGRELSSRQIQMTLTKPIGRWQYLLGKWLGVVLLNAVLVAVGGVAIYGFTMGIARNPALNDLDRYEVDREVLTARLSQIPDPVGVSWDQMYANVLADRQRLEPDVYGEVGDPIGALPNAAKQEVYVDTISRFYTVDAGAKQDYLFTGLNGAKRAAEASMQQARDYLEREAGLSETETEELLTYLSGRPNELTQETFSKVTQEQLVAVNRLLVRDVIQLVLTPDTNPGPEDLFVEITLEIDGQAWPPPPMSGMAPKRHKMVVETPNEIPLPANLINDDGTIVVSVLVPEARQDGLEQEYIQFNYKDAEVEMFYRVGSFEMNLARALVIVWLKLCFLAMLGIVAGSLMSFPVAATTGLVVYAAAALSGYINQSLDDYVSLSRQQGTWDVFTDTIGNFFTHLGDGNLYDAFRMLLRFIGESFMLMIPSFGAFPTAEPLSNGEVISGEVVRSAVLKIGLLWTGVVGLIGLFFFSRKELARVTV